MKDTFSKLHRDFSIDSLEAGENQKDGNEDTSNLDSQERNRRRGIGLKMLMSRDSSFGVVGFKSDDYSSNHNMNSNPHTKSFADDSEYNRQLQQVN